MNISIVDKFNNDKVAQNINKDLATKHFAGIDEVLSDKEEPDAIFLSGFSEEETFKLLKQIRKSDFYNIPVFTDLKGEMANLSDGDFTNKFIVNKTINEIQTLASELKHEKKDEIVSWKNRLLSYLYCRPDITLIPDTDRAQPMYYYYKLIRLFYSGKENYFYWLDDLLKQKIFSTGKLVDRIFCCPYCFSARLKFTDHCPHCNSINIRHGDFLHCFTCGLVAPQDEFIKNDRLICPRCNAYLLHAGEDYDRPLESGVCLDCGEYHIDSTIISFCLDCNKSIPTDRLNKRAIYECKLTDFGRNQIRFDAVDIVPIFKDSINYVISDYFFGSLDWFIKMQERYKDEVFSLLGLRSIFNSPGASYELAVELGKILRKTFRVTDLCTRPKPGYFWFILPRTDQNGLEKLKSRIVEFTNNIEKTDNIDSFKIKLVTFTSSQENISNMNGKLLIAEQMSKL